MSCITSRFADNKLLIPYIMGGWPDFAASASVLKTLVDVGCSIVEIGIPYSDPLADGPTIQRASEEALAKKVNTDEVLKMIKSVSDSVDFSPVLMVYYNLIYRYGLERFAGAAREAGVEGVIVPDLAIEESQDWQQAATDVGIDTIFLAAPTSSDKRLAKIADQARGFVYAVSLTGVTGARTTLPNYLKDFVGRVKAKTELPIAVGFGISQPEQAKEVVRWADGVIVGSALINLIEKTPKENLPDRVRDFSANLLNAIQKS